VLNILAPPKGNKLQRPISRFIQHIPHEAQYTSYPVAVTFQSTQKNSKYCPANQVSTAEMTTMSNEKW
jgi:hypothetical protein